MVKQKARWTEDQTVRIANEAMKLIEEHGAGLKERFMDGFLEGLAKDTAYLDGGRTGRPLQIQFKETQTGTERDLARQGASFLSHMREIIKGEVPADHPLLKAIGVGKRVNSAQTQVVATQLEAVAMAANEYPDIFRSAGIIASDIAQCQSLHDALLAADSGQGAAVTDGKDLTTGKMTVQTRLENAITKISNLGAFQYKDRPEIAARFTGLIPASGGGGSDAPPEEESPKA